MILLYKSKYTAKWKPLEEDCLTYNVRHRIIVKDGRNKIWSESILPKTSFTFTSQNLTNSLKIKII